jgi:hypothetical protein
MPTNIKIIHAHDFIKATPEGQLDFEESKKLLIEIAAASVALVEYEIILDARKVQAVMSATKLWDLAHELIKYRTTFSRKTAVLCPLDGFDYAVFFANCARERGFKFGVFTSLDDAIDWLTAEPDA